MSSIAVDTMPVVAEVPTRRRRSRSSSLTQGLSGVFVDCGPASTSPAAALMMALRLLVVATLALAIVMATTGTAQPMPRKNRVTPSPLVHGAYATTEPATTATSASFAAATDNAVKASSTTASTGAAACMPRYPYDSKGRGCCNVGSTAACQAYCWNKPGTLCPYMRDEPAPIDGDAVL